MRIILKLFFGFTLFFLLLFSFFWAESKEQIKVKISEQLNSGLPIAIDVKNFLIQNISGRSQILPLIGSDSDGTISSFKILSLPNNAHGTLYLNNVAVTNNQVLNLVQAKQLQFEVKSTFTGTASFTYTVTDNNGNSALTAATFSIPVTNDGTLLVCSGGGLGNNILGAQGTFSSPFITANPTVNCINNNSNIASPSQNLGNAKPGLTSYNYASTSGGLGPEGTYSFLKTLGTMAVRNCIKTDWVASDHTGDGGYAMIVNGSPNSATFGKTFYNASSIAVCPNTLYEFSAYVINALPGDHAAALPGTEPNISFYINNQLVSTSGAIPYSDASTDFKPTWVKVGGLWYSGPNTSVNLRIDNATFVASGNDLGLDDISLAICGPEITYPEISLTPKFCSYGVLPLKADIKASVNTYASYIFQNSTDGGITWTDMGSPATGSPVYNSSTGFYEYQAVYGDIPIDPSMNGYRYRLKVATDAGNLTGMSCNISADKIITVSAFEKPLAGADITGCNSSSTAKLKAAGIGETWSVVAGNPAPAGIDQSGNVTGMVSNGFYKFQLTNSSGCADTVSITRGQITDAGEDVAICSPQTTYKFADAGSGYKWRALVGNPAMASIDSLTGQVSGMSVDGNYRFILQSDFGGCTDEVIISRSTLSVSSASSNVNCYGTGTGAINLTVSGGTAPYSYSWSSGQSTEDLSDLASGTYTVTVTDAKGCTVSETIEITQPAAALTLSSTQTNVNCYGESTGSINLSVSGGTAPYSYSWSSGQATEDLSALSAGSYTVTVTDAKACTSTTTITITQPSAALTLSSTQTNVNCYGESIGSINLSVSGGTAPYSYSWSSGQVTEDLSALAAGSYTVTVADSKGCTATAAIAITQPVASLALSSTQTNVNCYGESTGSINLSVSGGTAPYSYSWSSGQATEDLSALSAGSYTVTVTDAKACTSTTTITITQPSAALTLSSTQTNVNCYGENTGSINLSVSGGTAPFTYSWSSGQVTEDLSALAAGSYIVTVTDAKGCTVTETIEITQPAALTLSSTQTNVNCYGASTGSINLTVSGGTAPYTYAWNNGQATEDLSALAVGSYIVTVTDAKACTATTTITITQPASVLALSSTQTNVNCYGANTGSINLSVSGGTAPYSYLWNTGQATEDISDLASSTYTVTVTDAKGCTVTEMIEITQPAAALALSSTQININCYGESTGAINLSVSGGTAPYTYTWDTGQTTEDLSALAAGNYTVTVTDAKGCTATATITITQPVAALTLSSTQTHVNCYGESTGAISLTVSGGTAPYSYSWNTGQITEDLSALAAGSYTVTVTDSKGCTATATIAITQPLAALALSSTQTHVNCYEASTGAINLSVSGGTAPYTYAWNTAEITEDLSDLAAGSYTVTVTDSKGCTATATIEITQPLAALTLISTQINVNCYGESTGAISLTVSGGTAPYSYSWSSGQATEDLSVLASGTYTVTVTDAKGCTVAETIEITQPAAALTLSSTQTNVNCYGESTGSINLSVSGGTAPYSYAWSSGQATMDLSALAAGSYTVTLTDAKGCTVSETIEITQPAAALTLSSTQTNVNCYGESTGSINLSVSGGTAPYSYAWSSGQATEDLSALAAGSYTVTVTDAKACTATTTIIITQPAAALALSSTQTNVNCYGESTGSINLSVSGSTAPYTYVWSTGQTTKDLSALAAGSYTVTVTDSKGCSATETIEITQPAAALALSSIQTHVNCYGASTGTINLTVSGGTAPYAYSWNSGQTTEDLNGLGSGSYTITVTDSKGCTVSETIEITQPVAALALSSTQINVNCFGESTGSINLSVSGGTSPYTYAWSSGQTKEDLSALAAGSYTVTVTDSKGCVETASITITQPAAALTLSSTQVNVNCYGESTGSINLSVSGGTAPYSYLWSTGQTTKDLSALAAGSYTVTVTDAKACTATTIIIITQPAASLALSSTQTNVNCYGESTGAINLTVSGGTAPYLYSWNTGKTTEDLSALSAGIYTVTVIDAKGCTVRETIVITQPSAALALSSTQTNVNCYGASTGVIDVSVSGGAAPYSYSWNTGQTTEDLSALAAGSYNVTVTDSKACTATATIAISQPAAALTLSSTQTHINCNGESTGSINLSISGGTAPYSYGWNSGQTTRDISALAAGNYTVTITDSKGCMATETIEITQPAAALALSSTQTNVNCYGESTGSINLSVSGGTAPYTYLWNTGQATEDLSALAAGSYRVTVTDAKGCTGTALVIITQPDKLSISFIVKNATCSNTSDGAISAKITGGKAPYTLIWNNNKNLDKPDLNNIQSGKYALLVTDSNGCSVSAETEILHRNCIPLAKDDSFKTEQQVPFTGDVSPNDSDPNNQKLTFLKLSDPENGKIAFNSDGKFSFQPDSGFNGLTDFTYQLCNLSGNCVTAKVQINVSPVSMVNLTPEISSVREGDKVSITARLLQKFHEDVFITIEYQGKAEKEKDYLVLDNYQGLKIPKGSLYTSDKITLAALNDAFEEGNEDIVLKIKTVSNPAVKVGTGALVTIKDVYPPPPVTDVLGVEIDNKDIAIDPLLSPNDDGLGNEYLHIRNIENYSDNEIFIFNRWGNELFYLKGYNNQDKIFKGYANKGLLSNTNSSLTDGVYYYIINTFEMKDGVRTKKLNKGYLILKR